MKTIIIEKDKSIIKIDDVTNDMIIGIEFNNINKAKFTING